MRSHQDWSLWSTSISATDNSVTDSSKHTTSHTKSGQLSQRNIKELIVHWVVSIQKMPLPHSMISKVFLNSPISRTNEQKQISLERRNLVFHEFLHTDICEPLSNWNVRHIAELSPRLGHFVKINHQARPKVLIWCGAIDTFMLSMSNKGRHPKKNQFF